MDALESIPSDGPIDNPETTSEPPTPEAPPPPKKKKLSEDRLTKLAKARARASEVAKEKREHKTRTAEMRGGRITLSRCGTLVSVSGVSPRRPPVSFLTFLNREVGIAAPRLRLLSTPRGRGPRFSPW